MIDIKQNDCSSGYWCFEKSRKLLHGIDESSPPHQVVSGLDQLRNFNKAILVESVSPSIGAEVSPPSFLCKESGIEVKSSLRFSFMEQC